MPRDSNNSRQMRGTIAHLAARLMAVDGIDDLALAKRKAARQAGAPETRNLPSNEEVEEALRAYQQLYQAEEQRVRLRHLRTRALEMMHLLSSFDPFLSGPVLSGAAGKYSDIDLHLFTDSVKDVELFFLNRGIAYRARERRLYIGDQWRAIPCFSVRTGDANFDISVFSPQDQRRSLRSTAEGRPYEHAKPQRLESILAVDTR